MKNKVLTQEEKTCEDHFKLYTRRLETGRYEVRLPLADNVDKLGESYDTAKTRFLALEKRLLKQPHVKKEFSDFLEEYIQLGHMTSLNESEQNKTFPCFYLPRNGVFKETS
jgi:hypothetical protein